MSIYTEKLTDDYYGARSIAGGKKAEKIRRDPSKHYPNKDEATLLRKIMAETGLNEDEVRSNRHYCELLSDAQKAGRKAKQTEIEKFYKKLIKEACKKTGFAPQHPDTLAALDLIIAERKGRSWGRRFFLNQHLTTAKNIVKFYAK